MKNRAFQEMVYRRNASYVQDLLNRISNKDSNALASLYSMTVDEVYKNFYSVLGSAYLAQDGTQALYVLFYRSIGTVKTPSQAAEKLSWLQSQIAARLSMSKKETPARKVQRPALTGREKELLLSELLDSLGLPDNSIPLEYIQEYDIYRGRRTSTMRWIIAIAALVCTDCSSSAFSESRCESGKEPVFKQVHRSSVLQPGSELHDAGQICCCNGH